eukprot:393459-Amphidinium_carterae.1
MEAGMDLEGDTLAPIRIYNITPASNASLIPAWSRLYKRQLRGEALEQDVHAETMVEVQTLCLEPHHWFYVQSVRVHNKGCFTGETLVTLADGSRKPLQEVRLGEEVASWNQQLGEIATSVVTARPEFHRDYADMVQLVLPQGALVTTKDHPLWSQSKQSLVSLDPEATRE